MPPQKRQTRAVKADSGSHAKASKKESTAEEIPNSDDNDDESEEQPLPKARDYKAELEELKANIRANAKEVLGDGAPEDAGQALQALRTKTEELLEIDKDQFDPNFLIPRLFKTTGPNHSTLTTTQRLVEWVTQVEYDVGRAWSPLSPIEPILFDKKFAPGLELQKFLALVTCSEAYSLKKVQEAFKAVTPKDDPVPLGKMLITALVPAIIVHWVMKDISFPSTELFDVFKIIKEKLMMEKNLDSASVKKMDMLRSEVGHYMLQEGNSFDDVISERAKELTLRLQKVIHPLIANNPQRVLSQWSDAMEVQFKIALQIQTRTRLNPGTYEWFWPKATDVSCIVFRGNTREEHLEFVKTQKIIFAKTPGFRNHHGMTFTLKPEVEHVKVDLVPDSSKSTALNEQASDDRKRGLKRKKEVSDPSEENRPHKQPRKTKKIEHAKVDLVPDSSKSTALNEQVSDDRKRGLKRKNDSEPMSDKQTHEPKRAREMKETVNSSESKPRSPRSPSSQVHNALDDQDSNKRKRGGKRKNASEPTSDPLEANRQPKKARPMRQSANPNESQPRSPSNPYRLYPAPLELSPMVLSALEQAADQAIRRANKSVTSNQSKQISPAALEALRQAAKDTESDVEDELDATEKPMEIHLIVPSKKSLQYARRVRPTKDEATAANADDVCDNCGKGGNSGPNCLKDGRCGACNDHFRKHKEKRADSLHAKEDQKAAATKAEGVCDNCGKGGNIGTKRLKGGRCGACYDYFRNHEEERPASLYAKEDQKTAAKKAQGICDNCGKGGNIGTKRLRTGRCSSCYDYFRKHKKEKPAEPYNRPAKQGTGVSDNANEHLPADAASTNSRAVRRTTRAASKRLEKESIER